MLILQLHHGLLVLAMDSQFIGRAEPEVLKILEQIFPNILILSQWPIRKLIPNSWYNELNEETKKHKFDFVVCGSKWLVIEVNYKHGEKAAKKWRQIFAPMIKELSNPCAIPVTINDYECLSLFKHTKTNHTKLRKSDYQDIINALQTAGVRVNFVIPECN